MELFVHCCGLISSLSVPHPLTSAWASKQALRPGVRKTNWELVKRGKTLCFWVSAEKGGLEGRKCPFQCVSRLVPQDEKLVGGFSLVHSCWDLLVGAEGEEMGEEKQKRMGRKGVKAVLGFWWCLHSPQPLWSGCPNCPLSASASHGWTVPTASEQIAWYIFKKISFGRWRWFSFISRDSGLSVCQEELFHGEGGAGTGCLEELWMLHHGNVQSQAGWGFGQPALMKDIPAHGRGLD